MKIRQWFAIACGAALVAGATVAAAQAGTSAASGAVDGLVKVKSQRFDEIYLRPGTELRSYKSVMLSPAQVTFAASWLKDMNAQPIPLVKRTTIEDAERIADKMRTGFVDVFTNVFKSTGFEVVAAPGPDVLSLSLHVIDLYINAPSTVTLSEQPSRVYTFDAGKATLALEVRDSTTGALLERVVDRRTAGDRGSFRSSLMITNPVSNRFNFDRLFDTWARDWVKSVDELKGQPPVAMNVPAQKH
jgi:hypothetical protein